MSERNRGDKYKDTERVRMMLQLIFFTALLKFFIFLNGQELSCPVLSCPLLSSPLWQPCVHLSSRSLLSSLPFICICLHFHDYRYFIERMLY